ncbi:hypothetical protein Cfor_05873 [Coptotermes formosanus]|uniref:Uncharacterized protein n=1 Tax=Coptotermes formosanus TaxID=36987 RepID=A0A6L2Q7V9_COPFO|nr:hypothetical protein Cfor_05873 [Coptotermes formosanus]
MAESVLVVCSGKLWNIHLLSSIWDGRYSGLELPQPEGSCRLNPNTAATELQTEWNSS